MSAPSRRGTGVSSRTRPGAAAQVRRAVRARPSECSSVAPPPPARLLTPPPTASPSQPPSARPHADGFGLTSSVASPYANSLPRRPASNGTPRPRPTHGARPDASSKPPTAADRKRTLLRLGGDAGIVRGARRNPSPRRPRRPATTPPLATTTTSPRARSPSASATRSRATSARSAATSSSCFGRCDTSARTSPASRTRARGAWRWPCTATSRSSRGSSIGSARRRREGGAKGTWKPRIRRRPRMTSRRRR